MRPVTNLWSPATYPICPFVLHTLVSSAHLPSPVRQMHAHTNIATQTATVCYPAHLAGSAGLDNDRDLIAYWKFNEAGAND